jgi:small basic protein (TIGR04137 family)
LLERMVMSIHSSLRSKGAHAKHRNVLSRIERIAKLEEAGKWKEDTNLVIGLSKVRNIKLRTKKKAKEEVPAEGDAAAAAAAPAAGAAPAAAAPAAAAGKPAAAAKPDAKGGKK